MKSEYQQMCSTKEKRAALTERIFAAVSPHGVSVAVDDRLYSPGRNITLSIGPWRIGIDLGCFSNVNAFLGHVYTDTSSDAKLPKGFESALGGSVNPYHGQKATLCEFTYAAFESGLVSGCKFLSENLPEANGAAL